MAVFERAPIICPPFSNNGVFPAVTIEQALRERSGDRCELCRADHGLVAHEVPPAETADADHAILVCATCSEQIDDPARIDVHHWRCLADSMWTPVPAVQVMAWRMLKALSDEGWARDLLDQLYLDDETREWAEAGLDEAGEEVTVRHLDSNGNELASGDTVVLIKDLPVKGGGFTAKRGTAVRGIRLVEDNPEQIEGRVNGQQIVILTKFVKKA